jgi:hypothetical protein
MHDPLNVLSPTDRPLAAKWSRALPPRRCPLCRHPFSLWYSYLVVPNRRKVRCKHCDAPLVKRPMRQPGGAISTLLSLCSWALCVAHIREKLSLWQIAPLVVLVCIALHWLDVRYGVLELRPSARLKAGGKPHQG